jgi:hypothetical protein
VGIVAVRMVTISSVEDQRIRRIVSSVSSMLAYGDLRLGYV